MTNMDNSTSSPNNTLIPDDTLFSSNGQTILLVLSVFGALSTGMAVCGNILALVIFILYHKKSRERLYLLNLTISDLIVGVFVLPLYTVMGAYSYTLPINRILCGITQTADVLGASESFLTVVLISYNRYLLVTSGAQYSTRETVKKILLKIAATWLVTIAITVPAMWQLAPRVTPMCYYQEAENPKVYILPMSYSVITLALVVIYNSFVCYYFIRKSRGLPPVCSRATVQPMAPTDNDNNANDSKRASNKLQVPASPFRKVNSRHGTSQRALKNGPRNTDLLVLKATPADVASNTPQLPGIFLLVS